MEKLFGDREKNSRGTLDVPTKRISTPAGQRLSTILENGGDLPEKGSHTRKGSRKHPAIAGLGPLVTSKHEYTTSVWSEGSASGSSQRDVHPALRDNRHIARRGGWRRLALILTAIIVCAVAAIVLGVVFGVMRKSSNNNSTQAAATDASGAMTSAGGNVYNSNPTATIGALASGTASGTASTATSSSFPAGSYSMVTFLDTVQANCTANDKTWRCYPYTTYNEDQSKSMATFNWIITAGSQKGSYQISSTDNPFAITFKNAPLSLLDSGLDSERYRFQITTDKVVQPSGSITDDNSQATCYYNGTNLQAYLYTKMAKGYPTTQQTIDATYPPWPFAVRVEQVIAGGNNVPNCYRTNNGQLGQRITSGLDAQDAGSLCSCLYKNWRTPSPYSL